MSLWLVLFVTLELLELHGPEGQTVWVNTHEITAIRAPNRADLARFTKGAGCIITLTDTKFLAVVETCSTIRDKLTK